MRRLMPRRRCAKALSLMCVILLASGSWSRTEAADKPVGFKGVILLSSGQRISFQYLGGANGPVRYWVKGTLGDRKVEYELHEFCSITRARGTIEVRTKDGRTSLIRGRVGGPYGKYSRWSSNIKYVGIDEVTGKLSEGKVAWEKVASVEIGSQSGSFRWNPMAGRYWPSHYNFDPIDGSELSWVDDSRRKANESTSGRRGCPCCHRISAEGVALCGRCKVQTLPIRTDTSAKNVDYFLKKRGIDSNSDQGRAAKRFAQAWLNPFSTEERIEQSMKELIQKTPR